MSTSLPSIVPFLPCRNLHKTSPYKKINKPPCNYPLFNDKIVANSTAVINISEQVLLDLLMNEATGALINKNA